MIKPIGEDMEEKKENGGKTIFVWEVIKRTALLWVCTLGVMIGFGLLLDFLEGIINSRMRLHGGMWLVIALAAVGTPVHELSHLLFCLLFRFHIVEVQLFRPQGFFEDGVLGYVSYAAPVFPNFFTSIGEFFVGFGPLILGGAVVILMIRLLLPEVRKAVDANIDELPEGDVGMAFWPTLRAIFIGFWKGLFSVRKWGIIRAIICLYICLSISMHMTLSPADIKNASVGLAIVSGMMLVSGIISAALKAKYTKVTLQIGVVFVSYYLIGLICDLILLGISLIF